MLPDCSEEPSEEVLLSLEREAVRRAVDALAEPAREIVKRRFGINGDPSVNGAWVAARIPDDPVKKGNKRGMITFATSGKDSRTTQVFVNYKDNTPLDSKGFAAFGEVTSGMSVVDSLYKGYGEGAPRGQGPEQGRVQSEGNAYLEKEFPKLDAVKTAKIE